MSSAPKDFDWRQLAPDLANKDQLARQVRIMLAAGKGSREISRWLQQNGLSPEQADGLVAGLAESRPSDRWEQLCGRVSLALIAVLSAAVLVLIVVRRPWDANWVYTLNGREIHPVAGFVLFGFLFFAAMSVLWFLAMRFGGFLDRLGDKHTPRGLWIALPLVLLLTVLALVALFTLG